jgi:hypothetical protein
VVAFGYYLQAPGTLVLADDDLFAVADIVAEALDPPDRAPRLDFAWLRLKTTPGPPRAPAPLRRSLQNFNRGDPVVALSAIGGTPIKADLGGTIFDLRLPIAGYFVANTDTAGGSSGGGAFDPGMNLLGIVARGGTDYVQAQGRTCAVSAVQPPDRDPEEEFTVASAALDALCAKDPGASSLCREDCGNPCIALRHEVSEGGCTFVPTGRARGISIIAGLLAALLLGVRRL